MAKEEKQGKVNEVFTNVADTYDKMNDAMSMGFHRLDSISNGKSEK